MKPLMVDETYFSPKKVQKAYDGPARLLFIDRQVEEGCCLSLEAILRSNGLRCCVYGI